MKRSGVTGVSGASDMVVDFITLGEIRINRELRVRAMESRSTLSVSSNLVALPSNFRAFKWLYLDEDPAVSLEYMSGEKLNQRSQSRNTKYYTFEGNNLRLEDTTIASGTIQYLAYIAATPLSGSTTTNTLFPRYADLYLYAALVEAGVFIEDEAFEQKHEHHYQRAFNMAQREDVMDRFSGSTLVARTSTNGYP